MSNRNNSSMRFIREEKFSEAVKTSFSIREVFMKLNVIPAGGNYASFHNRVKKLGLSTEHFKGQVWSRGKVLGYRYPIEHYLIESDTYIAKSFRLKKRLIKEGFFEWKCYNCNLKEWQGKPIPIELEHIDGNSLNNRLENLTILCANCHSQTSTFRRKKSSPNVRSYKELFFGDGEFVRAEIKPLKVCIDCGCKCSIQSLRCKSCASKENNPDTIEWPPVSELVEQLKTSSYLQVAKRLGVSDNAVRKRLRKRGINPKTFLRID